MRRTVAVILTIGAILASPNGAGAASRAAIAAPLHLASLHMIDARVGRGQNGAEVFRTTDGGQVWTDVTPSGAHHPTGLGLPPSLGTFFLSATTAWLAETSGRDLYNGRITVYRTTDGGLHWAASTAPATGLATPSFANARDGWLFVSKGPGAGQNPYILVRTVDGGATWKIVAQNTPTRQSRGSFPGCNCTGAVTFRNHLTGWSTGIQFALPLRDWLWISTDGGYTWRHQSLPIPSGLTVYFTDAPVFSGQREGAFLAALQRTSGQGRIFALYVTHDGGATWSRGALLTPLGAGAMTSSVVDPRHAWVSDGRRLYRTADGGRHWQAIYPSVPSFARALWTNGRITSSSPETTIDFVSATTGFAYDRQQHGTRPFILKTADGGATWQAIYPLSASRPLHD